MHFSVFRGLKIETVRCLIVKIVAVKQNLWSGRSTFNSQYDVSISHGHVFLLIWIDTGLPCFKSDRKSFSAMENSRYGEL